MTTEYIEVPGYGNPRARIMIVGEAPALTEIRVGRPFQGRAGEELNHLLASAHIDRDQCYLTNASLSPVKGDKDRFFFASKNVPSEVFLRGIVQLVRDIQRVKPNVIVPLGNYALWALTTQQQIMKRRGSILKSPITGSKLVPTIHPAALLRGRPDDGSDSQGGLWKLRTVVIWDLIRAKNESEYPDLRLKQRTIIIDPVDEDQAVDRLLAAPFITFDIESWGGTRLACIGFSPADPTLAYVFSNDGSNRRRALFERVLGSDNPKVGQNLMYDVTMLDQCGLHARNIWHDTMLAQHVLFPELPRGLDFLASIYTDIPYYKDEGKVWDLPKTPGVLRQFYEYNGKDVLATTEIALAQIEELIGSGQEPIFRREMQIFEPLRWVTYHGMRCDTKKLDQFIFDNDATLRKAEIELKKIAGPDFNPRSSVQMANLVYNTRKLPPRYKGGRLRTDANTLKDIEARTGDPIVSLIMSHRKAQKLHSNYFNRKILSPDNRIRSVYRIDGTISGRLSSAEPLWGPGLNGQNLPPQAREMLIADEGFELWELDQSQAEAVVVAYLANDPVHIDCFRYGKDVHRVTACYLLGISPDEWQSIPKKSMIRELAKKCNHGFNYDMQWMTFMLTVNAKYDPNDPNSPKLDPQSAKLTREVYMRSRPALRGYWDSIRAKLRQDRTLVTPLGRKHVFLDQWSDTMLRQAYSWIPQSTVGDATNIGIAQVYASEDDNIRYLFKHGMRLWGQVHDSAIFQVPLGARQYAPKLMRLLEVPMSINGYNVIIPIEGSAGPAWSKATHEPLGKSRNSCEENYEQANS